MRVDFSIILNPKLFNTLSAHVIPLPKNFPKSPNLFLLQMIKYVNIMWMNVQAYNFGLGTKQKEWGTFYLLIADFLTT